MPASNREQPMYGVVEGFYGTPWSHNERLELFGLMAEWGLNSYIYAPKDDLKHRVLWREVYTSTEAEWFSDLIGACHEKGVRFTYALGPGLDILYSSAADIEALRARFTQLMELGCRQFALLFDDIPDQIAPADLHRWGSFAAAQAATTNDLFRWSRARQPDVHFAFCPTPYCGRMASRDLGGKGYLEAIGANLDPEIDVFWTGPEIISREISVDHIRNLATALRRKPVLWDNLHANDYDGRRFYCGPYSGRPLELREEVRGIVSNPNCEFRLNYVPLRTLASFTRAVGTWNERAEYLEAMAGWLNWFKTVAEPISLGELIRFGDCHYLPYREGPEAVALLRQVIGLFSTEPASWTFGPAEFLSACAGWKGFFARLTQLENRPLFNALGRRMWDLREELDLLERYVRFYSVPANRGITFGSDYHLAGTYRGGMLSKLQKLLVQHPDSSFEAALRRLPVTVLGTPLPSTPSDSSIS